MSRNLKTPTAAAVVGTADTPKGAATTAASYDENDDDFYYEEEDDYSYDAYDDDADDGSYGIANVKGGGKKMRAKAPTTTTAAANVNTKTIAANTAAKTNAAKPTTQAPPMVEPSGTNSGATRQKGKGGGDKDEAPAAGAEAAPKATAGKKKGAVTAASTTAPSAAVAATPTNTTDTISAATPHTPADKVFARLSWDTEGGFRLQDYLVGYEDRFLGLRYMPAERFRNDAAGDENGAKKKKMFQQARKAAGKGGRGGDDNDDDGTASDDSSSSADDDDDTSSSGSSNDSFQCADKFKPISRKELKKRFGGAGNEDEDGEDDVSPVKKGAKKTSTAASANSTTGAISRKEYAKNDVKGSDIPFHRVRCFRRLSDGLLVWDRETRVDRLNEVAAVYAATAAERANNDEDGNHNGDDDATAVTTAGAKRKGSKIKKSSSAAARTSANSATTTTNANIPRRPLATERQELSLQLTDGLKILKHLQAKPIAVYGPTGTVDGAATATPLPTTANSTATAANGTMAVSTTYATSRVVLGRPLLDAGSADADAIMAAIKSTTTTTSSADASSTTTTYKALTYNVLHPFHKANSIHSEERFGMLCEEMDASGADVIMLQEVTAAFCDALVGIGNSNTNTSYPMTATAATALRHLRSSYWWTTLPSFGTVGSSNSISSQIIGSKYPIVGAGAYEVSRNKRHVFAVIADPSWCCSVASGASTESGAANITRTRPVPVLATAVHFVSDFAGPDAAGLRAAQFEALLQSLSSSRNNATSSVLPPFRSVIGADCNFGDQSEEMNRAQYVLGSSAALADDDATQHGWWRSGCNSTHDSTNAAATPSAPHSYHDAWLRQYAEGVSTLSSTITTAKPTTTSITATSITTTSITTTSITGRTSQLGPKPFSILKAGDVALLEDTNRASSSKGKRKGPLTLTDEAMAAAVQRTCCKAAGNGEEGGKASSAAATKTSSTTSILSPIGGFTFDARDNYLTAVMTERHFYPRRLDRILYDGDGFCLDATTASSAASSTTQPAVTLIGTTKRPLIADPTTAIHASDHYGVLARLQMRGYTYVCSKVITEEDVANAIDATTTTTTTPSRKEQRKKHHQDTSTKEEGSMPPPPPPAGVTVAKHTVIAKVKGWDVPTADDRDIDAYFSQWVGVREHSGDDHDGMLNNGGAPCGAESPASAAARSRVISTLAKLTCQWAAVTAYEMNRARDEGRVLNVDGEYEGGANNDENDDDDDDADAYTTALEARRRFTARLFITGSTVMNTHTDSSDIDAVLVLPGAGGCSYDEWFARLVAYLKATLHEGARKAVACGDDGDDDDDDDALQWLHAVVATPLTAKVPIIRLRCSDPDPMADADEDEDGDEEAAALKAAKTANNRRFFDVEFGIAVVRGFDKVPTKEELTLQLWQDGDGDGTSATTSSLVVADDTRLADEPSTRLIRDCCKADMRSVLSFDGLRSCSALVDGYFGMAGHAATLTAAAGRTKKTITAANYSSGPTDSTNSCISTPLTTAIRFIKHWAAARGVHGTSYGYPNGIGWAIMMTAVAQQYPLLASAANDAHEVKGGGSAFGSAAALIRKFFAFYSARLEASIAASVAIATDAHHAARRGKEPLCPPIYLNRAQPFTTAEEDADFGVGSWDPRRHPRDATALLPVLLPTPPYRNVCDKLTVSTGTVLLGEMRRGLAMLEGLVGPPPSSAVVEAKDPLVTALNALIATNTNATEANGVSTNSTDKTLRIVHVVTGVVGDGLEQDATTATTAADKAAVEWRLRQNLVESSLPTVINAIDKVLLMSASSSSSSSASSSGLMRIIAQPITERWLVERAGGGDGDDAGKVTSIDLYIDRNDAAGDEDAPSVAPYALPRPTKVSECHWFIAIKAHQQQQQPHKDAAATTTTPFLSTAKLEEACANFAGLISRDGIDGVGVTTRFWSRVTLEAPSAMPKWVTGHTVDETTVFADMPATVIAARTERKAKEPAAIAATAAAASTTTTASKKPTKNTSSNSHQHESYVHVGLPLTPRDFTPYTRTALVILPPREWWPALNAYRGGSINGAVADRSYPRWMPHITVVFPFVQPNQITEAIRTINEGLGYETIVAGKIGDGAATTTTGAAPNVTVGVSAFPRSSANNPTSTRTTPKANPWVFDLPTTSTFQRSGGSAVVFLYPKERADDDGGVTNPNSATATAPPPINEGNRTSQAQRLYSELQHLFPCCGRTPLIKTSVSASGRGPRGRVNNDEVAAAAVGDEEEDPSFNPHITMGRTANKKDTAAFIDHIQSTWPASLADPSLAETRIGTAKGGKRGGGANTMRASSAAEAPSRTNTTPPSWRVDEFHLIAHLAGTDGHQIIHTFKL